ncbi:MAG: segregation/condensation protein A [Candidatus Marsarchaeota archaeon]|nr:segregation/condensation protein A [Candidatus Marsarchaeota archaeon]
MNLAATTDESPYKIVLEAFEGPLDMLLHLIRENRIDIWDIPIVKVTEQYLAYLSLMESLDLEIAGEWLVMAATLLEIKSRMLLPKDPVEDETSEEKLDPRLELVERLIEYEKFKGAAEVFKDLETERSKIYIRGAVEVEDLRPKYDLENITAGDLLEVLQGILLEVEETEVSTVQRRKITVRMRMKEIWRRVSEASGQLSFQDLFDDAVNRIEVVVTFLALLELLKAHKIKVRQKKAFAPIEIIPVAESHGS